MLHLLQQCALAFAGRVFSLQRFQWHAFFVVEHFVSETVLYNFKLCHLQDKHLIEITHAFGCQEDF